MALEVKILKQAVVDGDDIIVVAERVTPAADSWVVSSPALGVDSTRTFPTWDEAAALGLQIAEAYASAETLSTQAAAARSAAIAALDEP